MRRRGFILIDRNLLDHPLYKKKPFDHTHAWLDILMLASFKDRRVYWMDDIVELKRGQLVTSLRYLANRWGWSTTKVRKAISRWTKAGSIKTHAEHTTGTLISVIEYERYQRISLEDGAPKTNTPRDTQKTRRQPADNTDIKKDVTKDVTKDKKPYGSKEAKEVLSYLNSVSGKRYQNVDSNLRPIIRRLNELHTSGSENPQRVCARVINAKRRDPDFDNKYLKVDTIFKRHWHEYIAELQPDAGTKIAPELPSNGTSETSKPDPRVPVDPEAEKLWRSILEEMEKHIDPHSFDVWLRPTYRAFKKDDTLEVVVANDISRGFITEQWSDQIHKIASSTSGCPKSVVFKAKA
tara:strand:- start:7192 stop:8244 length:1053 start_codon:yes stop_codon:yes gene_type:complete